MTVYFMAEAREKLEALLETACREDGMLIKRDDGQIVAIRPGRQTGSPLDVPGLELGLSHEEIVARVRARRQRPFEEGGQVGSNATPNPGGILQ